MKKINYIYIFTLGIIILAISSPIGHSYTWLFLGGEGNPETLPVLIKSTIQSIQLIGLSLIGLSIFKLK
ncbi:hypothetical protein [Paraclostridium dentum]|uniref:hypothetical protein n=1 Tax=Paraclostridium dentum TaxID=2662455 RepID=UPI0034649B3D